MVAAECSQIRIQVEIVENRYSRKHPHTENICAYWKKRQLPSKRHFNKVQFDFWWCRFFYSLSDDISLFLDFCRRLFFVVSLLIKWKKSRCFSMTFPQWRNICEVGIFLGLCFKLGRTWPNFEKWSEIVCFALKNINFSDRSLWRNVKNSFQHEMRFQVNAVNLSRTRNSYSNAFNCRVICLCTVEKIALSTNQDFYPLLEQFTMPHLHTP